MTTSTKRLVVIVGPTGSGKTDLSIRIALHYGAPILSTDSRQMYRGLPIGTAQPTADQLQAVEHHFIASHDLADNLSCGEYETQALACLERLFAGHDCVVAVGGSGLYVKALCEGGGGGGFATGFGPLLAAPPPGLKTRPPIWGGATPHGGARSPRRTVADARSGLLRGGRPQQPGARRSGTGGLPANRTALLPPADWAASQARFRHREGRH